ncbi:MAG: alginate lyase family protein [Opitutaceae bacterium]|jgi:hypothetical protein
MNMLTTAQAWQAFRTSLSTSPEDGQLLKTKADAALKIARLTIVDKKAPPHGRTPNDYASQAPYWWPDPATKNGLPYVRRDGEVNPEYYEGDRKTLEALCGHFSALVLQAYATGDAAPARRAGRLLRGWFIDAETRMNPHLRYAQGIPGICDGRGIGIIDTATLCFLIDEIGRLEFNPDWTPAHLEQVKGWFSAYLDWLLESDHGRAESGEANNHGTWYDAQVACFAVFCGRDDVARRQIERFSKGRIGSQIAPDGSQPHELARTLSRSYCTFNLLGFAVLAQTGRHLGLELWNWRPDKGAAVAEAVRWMLPYYLGERPWTRSQIGPFNDATAALLLSLAAQGTGDSVFTEGSGRLARHVWEKVSFMSAGVRKKKE